MTVIVVLLALLTVLSLAAAGGTTYLRRRAAEEQQQRAGLVASLRQVPATVGFLRRLATDDSLPAGVRLRLGAVAVYLVFPLERLPLVGRRVRR